MNGHRHILAVCKALLSARRPTSIMAELDAELLRSIWRSESVLSDLTVRPKALIKRINSLPAILAVALMAAWLPLSVGPTLWPDDQTARDFLFTLWQVQAGMAALILASAVFALQGYQEGRTHRQIPKLSEYLHRSGVSTLVNWSVSGVVLTGLVLLGWGNGSPRGWSGVLAIFAAGATLLLIPYSLSAASALSNPHNLRNVTDASLRHQLALAIKMKWRHEMAQGLLTAWLRPSAETNRPKLGQKETRGMTIGPSEQRTPRSLASRGGIILDVNVAELVQMVSRWGERADPRIEYHLGGSIRKDGTTVSIAESTSAPAVVDHSLIQSRVGDNASLTAFMDSLRADMFTAVADRSVVKVAWVTETYASTVEILTEWALEDQGAEKVLKEFVRRFAVLCPRSFASQALASQDLGILHEVVWLPVKMSRACSNWFPGIGIEILSTLVDTAAQEYRVGQSSVAWDTLLSRLRIMQSVGTTLHSGAVGALDPATAQKGVDLAHRKLLAALSWSDNLGEVRGLSLALQGLVRTYKPTKARTGGRPSGIEEVVESRLAKLAQSETLASCNAVAGTLYLVAVVLESDESIVMCSAARRYARGLEDDEWNLWESGTLSGRAALTMWELSPLLAGLRVNPETKRLLRELLGKPQPASIDAEWRSALGYHLGHNCEVARMLEKNAQQQLAHRG